MLSKFIKKQRNKRGISQGFVASELDISRPTYIQIESGKRDITITEAKKLANLFNISLESFLNEEETEYNMKIGKKKKKKNTVEIRIEEENLEKFEQALLYILSKVGAKENIGETVLHKLLYFIDFDYYEKHEENLMGAQYIKNHHGPTSIELGKIIKKMQKQGDIEAVKSEYFKYQQKKYLPKKRPDLAVFSAQEIEHIDGVLAKLSDKNAKEIERYSHQDIPWKIAKDGDTISYQSVFYRDEKYSVRRYEDDL